MKVLLLAHSPNPEQTVACAAKLCYSASNIEDLRDGLTEDKPASFVRMLSEIGHESPIEHASFTFGIEGVSRAFLAQITRHRIASFSVQSQRYVRADQFDFVIPPEIAETPEACELYTQAMLSAQDYYDKIAAILKEKHIDTYKKDGLSDIDSAKKAEKQAIEDARFVLPNAAETKMVVTMNARSLQNFFRHRCCNRAQWEIRAVADQMLRLCKESAPELFAHSGPPCINGSCPEGKMTCGKMVKMREKYIK